MGYFAAVAKAGSYSKAADDLCVTRQALSKAVAKLEDEVGAQLLFADEHGARVTERGALFLDEIAPLLAAYDSIERKYGRIQRGTSVSLAVSQGAFHPFPGDFVSRFIEREDDAEVRIEELHSDGVLAMVAKGDAEIGILGSHPRYVADFDTACLAHPGFHISVPQGHELAQRPFLELTDLDGRPFVTLGERNHLHRFFIAQCEKAGVAPRIIAATSDMAIFERFRAKESALAFACAPKYTQPYPDAVYVRLAMEDADKFGTFVIRRRDAALSPAGARLWDYLVAYGAEHPELLDVWREDA